MKKVSVFLVTLFVLFLGACVNSTKVGIPYPIPPCNSTSCAWNVIQKNNDIVKIALVNCLTSGQPTTVNQPLLSVIVRSQLCGISVFGVIKTNFGKRPIADIKLEIDLYVNLYKLDGIYFDEIPKDCSCQTYFKTLYAYIKTKCGGVVILNVGVNVPQCFGIFSDILVIFHSTYEKYQQFTPSPWCTRYPSTTFWHIVTSCPREQQRLALIQAFKKRAGYIYITADVNIDLDIDIDLNLGANPRLLNLDLDLNAVIRLLRLLYINIDNLHLDVDI